MKTVEIEADPKEKAAVPESLVREMYLLLGTNMTQIVGHASPRWQSDAEFREWKNSVFLAEVHKSTIHLLAVDDGGLRGFLSFTAPRNSRAIYLNEVHIRPSCQDDGVTLRCLVRCFTNRITQMAHDTVRTYSNKTNARVHALAAKGGVGEDRRDRSRIPVSSNQESAAGEIPRWRTAEQPRAADGRTRG